jgi:hypothetical protein
VLVIDKHRAIIDLWERWIVIASIYFCNCLSVILPLMDPVSLMDNNTVTYCRQKQSKHYFKCFFISFILCKLNSLTLSGSTKNCSVRFVTEYMIQFGHHLCVQPFYRMSSLCCRCKFWRYLLCHLTKDQIFLYSTKRSQSTRCKISAFEGAAGSRHKLLWPQSVAYVSVSVLSWFVHCTN